MVAAFHHQQSVVIDGETFNLVIDFRAIDATEQLVGYGYDVIVDEIQKDGVPMALTSKVLWGLLREHHPDLSLNQVLTLSVGQPGIAMGLAMSQLLSAAFPVAEKEKGENPQKPRGASKPSSNGGAKKG